MDVDILTELAFWKKKIKQKQKTTKNKKLTQHFCMGGALMTSPGVEARP